MRDNASDLIAGAISLAPVNESARGTLSFIPEFEVRENRSEEPLAGECQRHAARVDGNPASTPRFRNVRCCPASASRVENQVAWIRGQQEASLDNLDAGLNYVQGRVRKAATTCVSPVSRKVRIREVIQIYNEPKACFARSEKPSCISEALHPLQAGRPTTRRFECVTLELKGEPGRVASRGRFQGP